TLYKISLDRDKTALNKVLFKHGDWPQISNYYKAYNNLLEHNRNIDIDNKTLQLNCHEIITANFYNQTPTNQQYRVKVLYSFYKDKKGVYLLENLLTALEGIENKSSWTKYLPKLNLYPNNKFHRWVFGDNQFTEGIIYGDFGISYVTGEAVERKVRNKLFWSVLLSIAGIIIAYLTGMITSVYSTLRKEETADKVITALTVILFSIPSFWFAIILLLLFANPDVISILPVSGIKPIQGYGIHSGLFSKFVTTLPYLVLPTICYAYSTYAVVTQAFRASLLEEMKLDYVKTARAKGLTEKRILIKHAFKNALLPIITLFTTSFPLAIGGSLIIETVFNIPGMGNEIMQAVYHQDYPVLIAFFVLSGVVTLASYIIADIIYSIVDPRITLSKLA
ncbi:MAG: ABC transporter permease, partial [Flavobacteriales bacterium]|nr:ABC transporter permease [Flavobacteriales bacterium]